MSKKSDKKKRRVSLARQRAESHSSGFTSTTVNKPEGLTFFEAKPGKYRISILPYLTGEGNPHVKNEVGVEYFERTFWIYKNIGPEEKRYICPSKTFGKKDSIQEYRQQQTANPNPDMTPDELETHKKFVSNLSPKERQLFLLYDWDNTEKEVQLWDISYHLFGKQLDAEIQNSDEEDGDDLFYFGNEYGKTLRLTIKEQSADGYKFNGVTAITFKDRTEAIPKAILNHGICLDELLVETPYDELKALFDGEPVEKKKKSKKEKKEKKPKDDDDDDDDDAPEPESSVKDSPTESERDARFKVGTKVLYKTEKHVIKGIKLKKRRALIENSDGDELKVDFDDLTFMEFVNEETVDETLDLGDDDDDDDFEF